MALVQGAERKKEKMRESVGKESERVNGKKYKGEVGVIEGKMKEEEEEEEEEKEGDKQEEEKQKENRVSK